MQSDVVITGYRLNAKEPAQKALERILGLSPEVARALARSFPAVVLEGAANDNARRIRDQLESAGALVELRATQRAEPIGNAFDLDLDLPMGGGGIAAPAKASKGGTGAFATVPKTGPGGFPAPGKNGTGSLNLPPKNGTGAFNVPKTGGHLAVSMPPPTRSGNPRPPQPTARNLRGSLPQPPPPPPAAYQLGDFGVAPRGQSVVAKLPSAPASLPPASPPTLADGDFDFEASGGGGLELELGTGPRKSLVRKPSQPEQPLLGERFSVPSGSEGKAPEVEAKAYRAIQRRDSKRPVAKQVSLVERLLDGPLVALLVLLVLSALTLGAVGYALDPADPIDGLARARALPLGDALDEVEHQKGYLHPLLRSTPRSLRAPVAAVLRAQISGVHDVPVAFLAEAGQTAQCTLVEHGDETEARLARVRETGHEVNATPTASAQLLEYERALRAELQRLDLHFTRVCLVP